MEQDVDHIQKTKINKNYEIKNLWTLQGLKNEYFLIKLKIYMLLSSSSFYIFKFLKPF